MLVRVRERDQSEHIKCYKLLTKEIGHKKVIIKQMQNLKSKITEG